MGHEFIVRMPSGGEGLLPQLAARLVHTGRYEVEARSPEQWTLRCIGYHRQPNWPEDVVLRMSETGLHVLMYHTGPRAFGEELTEVYGADGPIEEL